MTDKLREEVTSLMEDCHLENPDCLEEYIEKMLVLIKEKEKAARLEAVVRNDVLSELLTFIRELQKKAEEEGYLRGKKERSKPND